MVAPAQCFASCLGMTFIAAWWAVHLRHSDNCHVESLKLAPTDRPFHPHFKHGGIGVARALMKTCS